MSMIQCSSTCAETFKAFALESGKEVGQVGQDR